jgi:hypothetical protein
MFRKRMTVIIVVTALALGASLSFTACKKNKPAEAPAEIIDIPEPPPQPAIFYATSNVRLRSQPDRSKDNRIAGIPRGGSVELIDVGKTELIDGIKAPWFKVKTEDGTTGWVFSGYFTMPDYQMTGTVITEYKGKGGSVIIPDGVTRIGESAFYLCKNLTSIIIPNSVINIGGGAFYGCTNLTSVTMPNSVTGIDNAQFDEFNAYGAFGNCANLVNITIPKNVKNIGSMAFNGCTNLTGVTFQSVIAEADFNPKDTFPGDLRDKYLKGGPGTYTRPSGGETWTKQ